MTTERNTLKADLTTMTTERNTLKADLETMTTQRNTLEADLETMTTQRNTLEADLATVTEQLNNLQPSAGVTEANTARDEAQRLLRAEQLLKDTAVAEKQGAEKERDTALAKRNEVVEEHKEVIAHLGAIAAALKDWPQADFQGNEDLQGNEDPKSILTILHQLQAEFLQLQTNANENGRLLLIKQELANWPNGNFDAPNADEESVEFRLSTFQATFREQETRIAAIDRHLSEMTGMANLIGNSQGSSQGSQGS
jgi:uncharacterized protein (DUF3084 family)